MVRIQPGFAGNDCTSLLNQFVNFRFGLSFKQDSSIFVLLKYSINKPLKPEVIFKKQHYTLDFLLIAQSVGAQENI